MSFSALGEITHIFPLLLVQLSSTSLLTTLSRHSYFSLDIPLTRLAAKTWPECGLLCQGQGGCKAWNFLYNITTGPNCQLLGAFSFSNIQPTSGSITGPLGCPLPGKNTSQFLTVVLGFYIEFVFWRRKTQRKFLQRHNNTLTEKITLHTFTL